MKDRDKNILIIVLVVVLALLLFGSFGVFGSRMMNTYDLISMLFNGLISLLVIVLVVIGILWLINNLNFKGRKTK